MPSQRLIHPHCLIPGQPPASQVQQQISLKGQQSHPHSLVADHLPNMIVQHCVFHDEQRREYDNSTCHYTNHFYVDDPNGLLQLDVRDTHLPCRSTHTEPLSAPTQPEIMQGLFEKTGNFSVHKHAPLREPQHACNIEIDSKLQPATLLVREHHAIAHFPYFEYQDDNPRDRDEATSKEAEEALRRKRRHVKVYQPFPFNVYGSKGHVAKPVIHEPHRSEHLPIHEHRSQPVHHASSSFVHGSEDIATSNRLASTTANLCEKDVHPAEPIYTSADSDTQFFLAPGQFAHHNRYPPLRHTADRFDTTRHVGASDRITVEQLPFSPPSNRDSMGYIGPGYLNRNVASEYRKYAVEPYISIVGYVKEFARSVLHPKHTEIWARGKALYDAGPSNY
jgi:hypothetical protein